MPEYHVAFEPLDRRTMQLPADLLDRGRYMVQVEEDGSVSVMGNRDGLLYLGELLIRCAIGEFDRGFHVHLPMSSDVHGPNVDLKPELTIYAADDSK